MRVGQPAINQAGVGAIVGDGDRWRATAPDVGPDRRTRRALAAKQRRSGTRGRDSAGPALDHPGVRDRIAEAVHRAVCELTGTDGFGLCMPYAIAGAGLLGRALGVRAYLQAGTLAVLADPPDGWMMMDATNFVGGEFHCWLGRPTGGGRVELIDFAARHYRGYCERLTDLSGFDVAGPGLLIRREGSPEDPVRPTWNRPAPPAYVWTDAVPTEWLRLAPHREATEAVWSMMLGHRDEYEPLVQLALERFEDLGRVPPGAG